MPLSHQFRFAKASPHLQEEKRT